MEKYSGVKIIDAEPMNLKEAEEKLRRKIKPTDEPGYFVKDPDGFNTWVPKWEFEKKFHMLNNLTFALALDAMIHGEMVTRASWNNKEMWLELVSAVQGNSADLEKPNTPSVLPFIGMRVAEYRFIPWVPNQADMLAGDYVILPPRKKPKQPGTH